MSNNQTHTVHWADVLAGAGLGFSFAYVIPKDWPGYTLARWPSHASSHPSAYAPLTDTRQKSPMTPAPKRRWYCK